MIFENTSILVLLIAHLLGDYYLQTNLLAKLKEKKLNKLVLHLLIYPIPFIIMGVLGMIYQHNYWFGIILVVVTHAIIDTIKFYLPNKWRSKLKLNDEYLYIVDQLLHWISIIIVGYFLYPNNNIDNSGLKMLLYLLIIFKPANITFKKVFGKLKISQDDIQNNAGAIIGSLERVLMVLLIILDQFAAIGLVLTAKSIARYNKIAEDSNFAEYYLIGTLYSVLVTILWYVILYQKY